MVSVLPGNARTPWDVIGQSIGQNVGNVLPGAVNQGFQRQVGLNALDEAQKAVETSGGDPYQIALAFARAGAQNPSLERALGPLMQTAMQMGRAKNIYGSPSEQQGMSSGSQPITGQATSSKNLENGQAQTESRQPYPSELITPSMQPITRAAYANILTPDQQIEEAKRRTIGSGDPNSYSNHLSNIEQENSLKLKQRENLANLALSTKEITPDELSEFLDIGSTEDTRNPDQWLINSGRKWREYKDNRDKLNNINVPGFAFGHFGDRQKQLKRAEPTIQDMVKNGQEKQARKWLEDNWLTPTEVEERIHPLTETISKSIEKLPKGLFPAQKKSTYEDVVNVFKGKAPSKNPFVDYDTAVEKDPRAMQIMQNRLADFFKKNVDRSSSISVLRDKLWRDKDYDWRQIGPAIRQAIENGLELSPDQMKEMTYIESEPPLQSLPDIFRHWHRPYELLRGAK